MRAYDASATRFDRLPKDGHDPARRAARAPAATADRTQPDAPELDLLRLQRGAGNAVVSRWLARQVESDTAAAAASAGPAGGATKDPAKSPYSATLTMDEVGAGIPLERVQAEGDWKRVSFDTTETSVIPKLRELQQTNRAVPKAELAIGSVVEALADVRVVAVALRESPDPKVQGNRPEGELHVRVTLVAAKAWESRGKDAEPETPDTWK